MDILSIIRSSLPKLFCKKAVLSRSLFLSETGCMHAALLKNRLQQRYFLVSSVKVSRTANLQNTYENMLLIFRSLTRCIVTDCLQIFLKISVYSLVLKWNSERYLQPSSSYYPVDTGRKLNEDKTFRRRPGRLLNILCTFNLRPVSSG